MTTSATRPVRSATIALSRESASTAKRASLRNASITVAPRPPVTTATCATSGGRERNAIPSPMASRIGNPNDQKSASGSRRNSLNRTEVSCQSESVITQLPAGESDEHIFERRRVRSQLGELETASGEEREQRWNNPVELAHLQLVAARQRSRRVHALNGAKGLVV